MANTVVKVIAGGPKGDKGDPGVASGDAFVYVHDQVAASATWTVVHGLAAFPNVSLVDTGGSVIHGGVHYDSANQVTVTFSQPVSGKAYLS